MAYITSSAANGGSVTFVPKTKDSYFYESFVCRAAANEGYSAISFALQGPVNGSVAVELQTQATCSDTTHNVSYNVIANLTGTRQQITLPLDSFVEQGNLNAIVAVAFLEFLSDGVAAWSIGNIQFVCGAATGTPGECPIPKSGVVLTDMQQSLQRLSRGLLLSRPPLARQPYQQ